MAVTVSDFRTNFPEFGDVTRYPDAQVTFWLGYADKLLYDECRWSDMRDFGIQLVAAHQLALWRRSMDAASAGGAPGGTAGAVASKAVGGVSVSYDTGAALLQDGGYWNLTTYGIQFWQLAMLVGTGGFQLY
jgi:hypothetical protein